MVGILISTAAIVIVMSGINGIEGLVQTIYGSFDPDIKITTTNDRYFKSEEIDFEELINIQGIEYASATVEEIALVKYNKNWLPVQLKGVDSNYFDVNRVDTMLYEGVAALYFDRRPQLLIGLGVYNKLGVSPNPNFDNVVTVYGLDREKKIRRNSEFFITRPIPVSGIFSINPDFDTRYIIAPMKFAQQTLDLENNITAVECKLQSDVDAVNVKEKLQLLLGPKFSVQTRFEQNELIYRMSRSEKWFSFVMLCFILALATFNIIASLTMLIFDKKTDINTLIALGATRITIQRIFFFEGLLINFFGGALGLTLGYLLCFLQINFHLIPLHGTIIDYYPVKLELIDFFKTFVAIATIGIVSSYFPVRYLVTKHFQNR